MVLFAVYTILTGGFQRESFSVLAVFAVATIRIVPSTQRILQAINAISFFRPSIDIITDELVSAVEHTPNNGKLEPKLQFRQILHVSIDSFGYPGNRHFLLKDIDFSIKQGQKVAFIGRSGSTVTGFKVGGGGI
jgi:ABC-type multidrug transport system fused ATPase/permease subunit